MPRPQKDLAYTNHVKISSAPPTDKETAAATPRAALDRAPQLRHHSLVETRCAQCRAAMTCQPEGRCWCAKLPHVPMPAGAEGCLCRNCLGAKIEAVHNPGKTKDA